MPRVPSLAAVLVGLAVAAGCSDTREPIVISEGTLHVENQTSLEWRNVMVTVNDHFRGGTPQLAAGGRLTAPLGQFQTAYGQRFVVARQTVFKVEVTATDSSGAPVKLQWGETRR
jgi:hypothetical protein